MPPLPDEQYQVCARSTAYTNFEHSTFDVPHTLPLPGIIILVHGVNSDGEWYEACEQGLCAGLNRRLSRRDSDLAYPGPASGQLAPVQYAQELTNDGFINPDVNSTNFFSDKDSCSPVIRFRWGYKASARELQVFGNSIYLNEDDYWGGGPFANGCSALPDLWNEGLSDDLFLWLQVQHMNPVNDRHVYTCPHRGYYVFAAWRLARLVAAIRREQADVPITIVCHSQGNMIGMAAAFLGDSMAEVTDGRGKSGPCVADNYVLCNPPYSLVESNFAEDLTQLHMRDAQGRSGRQTHAARIATLAAFFDIVRQRRVLNDRHTVERINRRMAAREGGFHAQTDRDTYGLEGSTYGRVTLYCNPHDQVISALTVQGIGWRGVSQQECAATGAAGVLVQRVFAHGFAVGSTGVYGYWTNHWRQPAAGSHDFWLPHSKVAYYSIKKGLEASKSLLGSIFTIVMAPLMVLGTAIARTRINAIPDKHWVIPVNAPPLPEPFMPQCIRFGQPCSNFDQGYESQGAARDQARIRSDSDPYAGDRQAADKGSDTAQGDHRDEAALRYEHHALLRMKAKREGLYRNGDKVTEEDDPGVASAQYTAWRNQHIKATLAETVDTAATDHSTIMTNPMHSEKALAYDVAVGVCDIPEKAWAQLRILADWRYLSEKDCPWSEEYFRSGHVCGTSIQKWITRPDSEMGIPSKIIDQR